MDVKSLVGIAKVEPSPELDQADVSNDLGAGVGSSESANIKVKWLYDASIPFEWVMRVLDTANIGPDPEVFPPYRILRRLSQPKEDNWWR